jgi:restriction system protein
MQSWMVRSGEGGYLFDEFKKYSIIAIGWNETSALKKNMSLDKIKELIIKNYSDYKDGQIISSSTQIYKFLSTFEIDDYVITYNRIEREYLIGKIASDYFYSEKTCEYYHQRKVNWMKTKSRDSLCIETKNTLGSTLTIFTLSDNVMNELLSNDESNENTEKINED